MRRHQRRRRLGRKLSHVQRGHLRPVDPRRLRAGLPGVVPGPQPHRHPGGSAGRGRDGRAQRALHHRRRRDRRRPAAGQACVRPGQHPAPAHGADHPRQWGLPQRAEADGAAAALPGRGGESLRAALRLAAPAAGEEDRRRRGILPDAVLLRRAPAADLHAAGARPGTPPEGVHPGGRGAAALRHRGGVPAQQGAGRLHARRGGRAAARRAEEQTACRGQAHLRGDHPAGARDRGCGGHPRHGLPPGGAGGRDRRRGWPAAAPLPQRRAP